MHYTDTTKALIADGAAPLTLDEYKEYLDEIEQQPVWRAAADKEADYADGNQLDTELLRAQAERGIPPAIEDMIGPALLSIQGYEAKTRTDWRVTPNGQPGGQDVADALNFKLKEAEHNSKADKACSNAFRPQISVGIGWVEAARESNPFKYPYRCNAVHRNEIHWDFTAQEDDLSDARYLLRRRWMHPSRAARSFPKHKAVILEAGKHGSNWWSQFDVSSLDGGDSTGLRNAWHDAARSGSFSEARWYDATSKEICIGEMWYRRWVDVGVITTPDGRVVEYDQDNPAHNYALATGLTKYTRAVVARVRRSYWLGPHMLHDSKSPYSHRHFPYVPFWGFREDSTRVPYGYVRGAIYQQDSLNSGTATLRWGMGAVRTERTKGAVAMTDAQFRKQVARRDADIVLDAQHMAQQGARFEVKRDYELTQQHFAMLDSARAAIDRISPSAFAGRDGTATSGLQEQTQVEQANQTLGAMMDNFRAARTQVGEMLLSMLIEDMGSQQQVVVIEGDAVTADRSVVINRPEVDPDTGYSYLSNDLQRTRLLVGLEDVPSSATYRGQQLNAMSEAIKSLPAQFQAAAMPFLASLMDVPFKRDLVEALRAAAEQDTPEQAEERTKKAVDDALVKAGNELKGRELDLKEARNDAEIKKIMAQAVQVGVQAAFSAMQGGAQVAQMPMIAPIADEIMKGAGYQLPTPGGMDPNFPVPTAAAAMNLRSPYTQGQGAEHGSEQIAPAIPAVQQNTSPAFPPVPQQASSGMQGIETTTTEDNIQ